MPRGYGLTLDGSYDFYRKKENAEAVEWVNHTKLAVPSDIYEWYSVNGLDFASVQALCAPDQRCSGFYMCTLRTAEVDNCKHLLAPATAVLLSGVPAPSLLLPNKDSIVVSKKMAATCGGNAVGATCNFPFTEATAITQSITSSTSSNEFYECSIANSESPWCFTTRPGKWGYCDCNGFNPLGLEWKFEKQSLELGEWSRCSKSCGGGIKTRVIKCLNSTTGQELDNINLCGKLPATYEICNTHDCDEGCDLPHPERKICSGFYEDPLSKVASSLSQKNLCKSYGCCFAKVTHTTPPGVHWHSPLTPALHAARSIVCPGAGTMAPCLADNRRERPQARLTEVLHLVERAVRRLLEAGASWHRHGRENQSVRLRVLRSVGAARAVRLQGGWR